MKNKIIFIMILIAFCLFTGCKEENKEKEYTFDVIVSSDKLSYGESTNIKVFCDDVEVEIIKLETSGDIVTVTDSVISYNKKGKCDIKVYFNYLGKEYTESLSVECLDLVKYEFEIVNESLYKGETQEVVIKSGEIVITDFVLSTFDEGVIKADGNSICGVYQGKTFVYADFTYQGVNYHLRKEVECLQSPHLERIRFNMPEFIYEGESIKLEYDVFPLYSKHNLEVMVSDNLIYEDGYISVSGKSYDVRGIITLTDFYTKKSYEYVITVIRDNLLMCIVNNDTLVYREKLNESVKIEPLTESIYSVYKKYGVLYVREEVNISNRGIVNHYIYQGENDNLIVSEHRENAYIHCEGYIKVTKYDQSYINDCEMNMFIKDHINLYGLSKQDFEIIIEGDFDESSETLSNGVVQLLVNGEVLLEAKNVLLLFTADDDAEKIEVVKGILLEYFLNKIEVE